MENLKRRRLLVFLVSAGLFPILPSSGKTKTKNPYDEKRLIEQNKRVQRENNAPDDFPSFVREGLFCFFLSYLYYGESTFTISFQEANTLLNVESYLLEYVSGFEVKVVASDNYVKRESGLIYRDFEVGNGDFPKSGQQVFPLFHQFL